MGRGMRGLGDWGMGKGCIIMRLEGGCVDIDVAGWEGWDGMGVCIFMAEYGECSTLG